MTEASPNESSVKAIFVYYTNNKNTGRDGEIYNRFKANFPASFRLIIIQTQEATERMECIYPRFIVADDFAKDLSDMGEYLRKSLQLEGADDTKKNEILGALGYTNKRDHEPV